MKKEITQKIRKSLEKTTTFLNLWDTVTALFAQKFVSFMAYVSRVEECSLGSRPPSLGAKKKEVNVNK